MTIGIKELSTGHSIIVLLFYCSVLKPLQDLNDLMNEIKVNFLKYWNTANTVGISSQHTL
jgi:hypothetical protein